MKNQFPASQLFYSSRWYSPQDIIVLEEYHSTAMKIIPILIVLERLENPTMGYYYAGLINEFYQVGSPSRQSPILWTPLPPIPKK